MQLGSKHQAATEYVNAGTCYKKADPNGRQIQLYRRISSIPIPDLLINFFVKLLM
jgi:hypothetical protein